MAGLQVPSPVPETMLSRGAMGAEHSSSSADAGPRAAQHPELLQAVSETRASGSMEMSSRVKWELHNPYSLPAIKDSYGAFEELGQEALMKAGFKLFMTGRA